MLKQLVDMLMIRKGIMVFLEEAAIDKNAAM
jgi:hypothetical protein